MTGLLTLPPPEIFASKAADHLNVISKERTVRPSTMRDYLREGDLVSMIGLMALSCGKLIEASERRNTATVEWYNVLDPEIWGTSQIYISCYCRYSDLIAPHDYLRLRVRKWS